MPDLLHMIVAGPPATTSRPAADASCFLSELTTSPTSKECP